MQSTYWLSILIPAYNVEPYLIECLRSVVQQADSTVEIIALDDCSTDASKKRLVDFSNTSPLPIKILEHKTNQGLSAARNTMLNQAQGDYVWFLDSDDVMEPNALQELKTLVDAHTPDLILCDFRVLREHQQTKHKLRGENHRATFAGVAKQLLHTDEGLFYGLYALGELHIWSKISKRELWGNDLRFPVGRTMEDMVITPRLALRAKTFYYQPSVWIAYRRRQGSILTTPNEKKLQDAAQGSHGVLAEWLSKYPQLSTRARLAFSHYCARTHYFVLRDLRSLHSPDFKLKQTRFRKTLFNNIQWSGLQLCWQYLKCGKISRVLRFLSKH